MRYKIFLLIFSCFLSTLTYAQAIKVSGRLVDENQQAIDAAAVILARTPDNQMLEYSITDKQGNFTLQHDKKGTVQLIIKHLSYGTEIIALPEQCDTVLNITLSPAPYEMEEVAVKGKRVPIQFKNGDWVINVENYTDKGTERSMDILKKLPGISINEENKQIKLNGKDVELQLNGVPQPVTFELLKSLPSHLLDQIVLTPTKRAEHDGPSDHAIIDIKTKKKYIDGFMGNIDGSYGTYRKVGLPGESEGNFFVMLMKKNFYLNLMLHGEDNKGRRDISDSTWYGATQTSLVRKQRIEGKNEWATITNLNLSWDVKNGNRINANFYLFSKKEAPDFFTEEYAKNNIRNNYFRKNHEKRINPTGNIQYESSESLPFELKASYGYIGSYEDDRADYQNEYADTLADYYAYFYHLTGRQHVFKLNTGKHFYNKKLFIGLGGNANLAKTTNDIRYEPATSVRQTEYFDYREKVGVGYLSLMYEWSKKGSFVVGIRAEYTKYTLQLATVNLKGSNQYWNWLPSMGINLNISDKYNTSLALNSGMGRPNYNALTPQVTYVSDKFYYKGNPLLKPSKSFQLEWSNNLYRKLSISTGWQYTKDLYTTVLTDKGNEVTESSYQNCFDEWQAHVNLYYSLSFIEDRLRLSMNGAWYFGKYRNFRNDFVVPRNRNTGLEGALNFDYWLTNNYRMKVFGNVRYSAYNKNFQTDIKGFAHANLGIRYRCTEKYPLYLTLRGTDIFNSSRKRITTYYNENIRYTQDARTWQGFQVTLSFNFQGGKDLKRREIDGDVNAEDKRFDE